MMLKISPSSMSWRKRSKYQKKDLLFLMFETLNKCQSKFLEIYDKLRWLKISALFNEIKYVYS